MGEDQIQSTVTAEPVAETSGNPEPVTTSTAPSENQGEQVKASPEQGKEPAKASEPAPAENQQASDEVPPKRVSEFQKYMTQKTQELSKTRQDLEAHKFKVEAYDKFMQTEYNDYVAWRQSLVANQPVLTESDIEAMQTDPSQIPSVVEKLVAAKVKPLEEQMARTAQQVEYKETLAAKKEEILQVAEMYPEFWDLYDNGILKPIIKDIVDSGKGTLIDAINKAKEIEKVFLERAQKQVQGRVQEKKNGSIAAPTPTGSIETVWVKSKQEAARIAFENAVLGKRVNVKVKQ
jgi:hypothetical protein